jgi:ribulose-phosphate 3-epimerase
VLDKISQVKEVIQRKKPAVEIEVDGNINEATGKLCLARGADILVAGTSSVFKKGANLYSACVDFRSKLTL